MPRVTLDTTSAYLAVPEGPPPGPWPGVVVIHESWGFDGHIRAHSAASVNYGEVPAGAARVPS
jgi:dienelactone hydrolase